MKFFHLSDLHIGKHLFYYSLLEDQKYVFHQILEAAKEEQPDAVLLCGDIYDKTIPSAEAVSLFDWFLTELKETLPKALILIIAGNHDRIRPSSALMSFTWCPNVTFLMSEELSSV